MGLYHADEWKNFLERVDCNSEEELRRHEDLEEELRLWASYRGQTLTRTGIDLLFENLPVFWIWEWFFYFYFVYFPYNFNKKSAGDDVLSESSGTSGLPWYGKRRRYSQKAWWQTLLTTLPV